MPSASRRRSFRDAVDGSNYEQATRSFRRIVGVISEIRPDFEASKLGDRNVLRTIRRLPWPGGREPGFSRGEHFSGLEYWFGVVCVVLFAVIAIVMIYAVAMA
jgi:hypothetical protein